MALKVPPARFGCDVHHSLRVFHDPEALVGIHYLDGLPEGYMALISGSKDAMQKP
jgi:hypothetical protein